MYRFGCYLSPVNCRYIIFLKLVPLQPSRLGYYCQWLIRLFIRCWFRTTGKQIRLRNARWKVDWDKTSANGKFESELSRKSKAPDAVPLVLITTGADIASDVLIILISNIGIALKLLPPTMPNFSKLLDKARSMKNFDHVSQPRPPAGAHGGPQPVPALNVSGNNIREFSWWRVRPKGWSKVCARCTECKYHKQ